MKDITEMKKNTYTQKQITEALAYWKKQLKKLDESEELNEQTSDNRIQKFNSVARQALRNAGVVEKVIIDITADSEWAITKIEQKDKSLVLHLNTKKDADSIDNLDKFVEHAKKAGLTKLSDAQNIIAAVDYDGEVQTFELKDVFIHGTSEVMLDFDRIPSPEEMKASLKNQKTNDFLSEDDKKEAEEFLS